MTVEAKRTLDPHECPSRVEASAFLVRVYRQYHDEQGKDSVV